MSCPDDAELAALLEGRLDSSEAAALAAHFDGCDDCRALVADAARLRTAPDSRGAPPSPEDPTLPAHGRAIAVARGATIGRYVILERLGQGGMGVVYRAYDPELDRRIALKLVRADSRHHLALRQRLVREAQAMARVSHANVLTVYDAGTVGDEVFIAMELVDGVTLGRWLRAERRAWRDVIDRFVGAGRGLAAAHAAGLVHRDFKPDNVLVAASGAVRVTDFGLARAARESDPDAAPSPSASPSRLTQTGAVLGTPAYMAPEQVRGEAVDARADQFSFCVALYEALWGETPFSGK